MGRHSAWKGVGMGQDGKLMLSVQRHYKSKSVIIPVGVILFKDLFLLSMHGCFLRTHFCISHARNVLGGQKRALNFPDLEL